MTYTTIIRRIGDILKELRHTLSVLKPVKPWGPPYIYWDK